MGSESKEAVCEILGHILDEQQQQQHDLGEIKQLLQASLQSDKAELVQVNKRVTALERAFRGSGGAPSAA